MRRVVGVDASEFRKLRLEFDDGLRGELLVTEPFVGAAVALNNSTVFASAHAIDGGHGIGFDGCSYDICAQAAYEEIFSHNAAAVA